MHYTKYMNYLKHYKKIYKKQLEICFILSLSLMIVIFYAVPRFSSTFGLLEIDKHPEIIIVQIPRTIQKSQQRQPKPVLPEIPVPSDEVELLEEVKFKPDTTLTFDRSRLFEGAYLSDNLPYLPRQILEVLPKREENVSGRITLSVRVSTSGYFVDHRVVENTTNSESCLNNVINAAKKSRWEPILLGSRKVEYWIIKTYWFESSE